MPDEQDRELAAFERNIREAVARREQERRQQAPVQPAVRNERAFDRGENPLELPARHQAENHTRQEARLLTITDPGRRTTTEQNVSKYYEAWTRALKKAYAMRYELSPRLYEQRVAERRIDPRLIPPAEKEKIHNEAVREAVSMSLNRMRDINHALPVMIDKIIDDAARYTRARDNQAEALRNRPAGHDQNKDRDRDR
jgi:hypothetical protein